MLQRTTAICVLLLAAGACGSKVPSELAWTEEVRLAAGTTILVDRHETYNTYREAGFGELRINSSDLVIHPANGAPLPALKFGEFPIIADYDAMLQQWFVITVVEVCTKAHDLGLGKRPYLEYRLSGSQWVRAPAGEQRVGLKANLLITKSLATESARVSIAAKEKRESDQRSPDYLVTVAAAVCPEY